MPVEGGDGGCFVLDRSSLSIRILERTRSKNYRGKEICCVSISLFLDFGSIFFITIYLLHGFVRQVFLKSDCGILEHASYR